MCGYAEITLRSRWMLDEVSQSFVDFKEKKQAVGPLPRPRVAAMQKNGRNDDGDVFKSPMGGIPR